MKLFIPRALHPEHKVEIQILERGCIAGLFFKPVGFSTIGGAFQIVTAMDPVLRAEQIAHDDEPHLRKNMCHGPRNGQQQ